MQTSFLKLFISILFLGIIFNQAQAQVFAVFEFGEIHPLKRDLARDFFKAIEQNRPDLAIQLCQDPAQETASLLKKIGKAFAALPYEDDVHYERFVEENKSFDAQNWIERTYFDQRNNGRDVLCQIKLNFEPGECNLKVHEIEWRVKSDVITRKKPPKTASPGPSTMTGSGFPPPPPKPPPPRLSSFINWETEEVSVPNKKAFDFDEVSEIPQDFDTCEDFCCLTLVNIAENEFPPHLWESEKLQQLRIFSVKLKQIPDELPQLKNLEVLWIQGMYIDEIPKSIYQIKSLTTLRFDLIQKMDLTADIVSLKKLKHLTIRGDDFSLPKVLTELPALESVTINGDYMTKENGLDVLFQALRIKGTLIVKNGKIQP